MALLDSDDQLAALLVDFLAVDAGAAKLSRDQIEPAAPEAEPQERLAPYLRWMLSEQCDADPDRMPWPDEWFDGTDSGQVRACRDLWAAALIVCIRSALDVTGAYDARPTKETIGLSLSWFRSKDFHMMCALAGLDGVACMDRLTDPDRLPEIIAAFQGSPRGGAVFHEKQKEGGSADGHI